MRSALRQTLTAHVRAFTFTLAQSTVTALDWLFTQRLIRVGTLIAYDDFWTIPCSHAGTHRGGGGNAAASVTSPLDVGEGKAHREMAEKHGVRFECIGGPCRPPPTVKGCHKHHVWAPVFVVTAIGNFDSPDHGFNFSHSELARYMAEQTACRVIADEARASQRQGGAARGG